MTLLFNHIKYKTFQGTAISSWQEGIEDNTIVLYGCIDFLFQNWTDTFH